MSTFVYTFESCNAPNITIPTIDAVLEKNNIQRKEGCWVVDSEGGTLAYFRIVGRKPETTLNRLQKAFNGHMRVKLHTSNTLPQQR